MRTSLICVLVWCLFSLSPVSSRAERSSLAMLPHEHPGLVKMPFDATSTLTSGTISDTTQQLPYHPWESSFFFAEVMKMPYRVETSACQFNAEVVDSATAWVRFGPGSEGFPFDEPIYAFDQFHFLSNNVGIRWVQQNMALFDGYEWTLYRFGRRYQKYFVKTDLTYVPNFGLCFGSASALEFSGDYEAQGICRITGDGVVERIFWPPLLKRWQGRENLGAYGIPSV